MRNEEEREQAALFAALDVIYRETGDERLDGVFHVPNGGRRDIRTGARLKAAGVKAGVLDVWLPCPGAGGYAGLVVEMKSGTGRLRPDQKVWIDRLTRWGWRVHLARTGGEALRVILEHLGITVLEGRALVLIEMNGGTW